MHKLIKITILNRLNIDILRLILKDYDVQEYNENLKNIKIFLTIKILFRIIKLLPEILRNNLLSFQLIKNYIFLKNMNTDILISFKDNSPIFSFLSLIEPNFTTIAIQNGQRFSFNSSYKYFIRRRIPISYDIYLGHGGYIKNIFDKYSVNYNNLFNIGSIREIYNRYQIPKKILDKPYREFIWISNWRGYKHKKKDILQSKLIIELSKLINLLKLISNQKNIELKIMILPSSNDLESPLFEKEKNYYLNQIPEVIFLNPKIKDFRRLYPNIISNKSYFIEKRKGQCIMVWTSTLLNEYNARDFNVWSLAISKSDQYKTLTYKRTIYFDQIKNNLTSDFFSFIDKNESPSRDHIGCSFGSEYLLKEVINKIISVRF